MTLEDLIAANPAGTVVDVEYYEDEPPTQALLFRRELLDEDWEVDLQDWMDTGEEYEDDEDLVLFGIHGVGEDTQVDMLFYYRKSDGDEGPIYTVDVDGTIVPGSLERWKDGFDAFTPRER